jgi:ABC-2 type transport system ATP-binding protein
MTAIVQVTDLRKRYGDIEAVRGITFAVETGEVFGMLGPNGAGKTTTVEILEGLRKADSGSAVVAGVDVFADPAGVKRRIGVQLQSSAFPEHLTAKETVEFFATCYDLTVDARALLRSVDLEERAGQLQEKLSGGQRQRLSIARALLVDPRVLILDDATASVDASTEARIRLGLRQAMEGRTTLIIAHRLSTIALADEIVVLDQGRIAARGEHEELLEASAVYRDIYEHGLLERQFADAVEARALGEEAEEAEVA